MNFTPFATSFNSSIPSGGAVAQFTTAKFAHQVSGGSGQVLGVLSADEAGVTYLRPVDTNGLTFNIQQAAGNTPDGSPQVCQMNCNTQMSYIQCRYICGVFIRFSCKLLIMSALCICILEHT